MIILKIGKLLLLPVITAGMVVGCSTAPPKSEELIAAEQYYQSTLQDSRVSQHAASELDKASVTLKSAAKAETTEQMAALVYVGNNQISTAIVAAEINASVKRVREIMTLISNLPSLYGIEKKGK
jgi:hypothetical protein